MKHPNPSRRGFTLLEVTIAAALLILCGAVIAQMLHLVARVERSSDARQAAVRAVANRLEQLQARSWDKLPVAKRTAEAAPAEILQVLPRAQLWTEVIELEEGQLREIRVQIDWTDAAGNPVQPVSLSAWKHRPATAAAKEEQP
jgi:prepilin-type N-terminal cleavage/methylation domain-containing protein